jgi:hypothetical protein
MCSRNCSIGTEMNFHLKIGDYVRFSFEVPNFNTGKNLCQAVIADPDRKYHIITKIVSGYTSSYPENCCKQSKEFFKRIKLTVQISMVILTRQ